MVEMPRDLNELANFICSAMLFSEARVLYELSRLPFFSVGADQFHFDHISPELDTAFVMGSGSSINAVTEEEWEKVAETGDVFSFNYFFKGQFVPIDYHLAREVVQGCSVVQRHSGIKAYFEEIERNSMYTDTRFFVLHDHRATDTLWGTFYLGYLSDREVCLYQNDRDRDLPGESIDQIAHNAATLFDVINLAYLIGYSEIVLMGVDLHDQRYFWDEDMTGSDGEKSKGSEDKTHETANPVIELMPKWETFLAERGVRLSVQNPDSLLRTNDILPLYGI